MILESKTESLEINNDVVTEFQDYLDKTASRFLDYKKEDYEILQRNNEVSNLIKDFITNPKLNLLYFIITKNPEEIKIMNKLENFNEGLGVLYIKKEEINLENLLKKKLKSFFLNTFHLFNIGEITSDFNPISVAHNCFKNGLNPILKTISSFNTLELEIKESIIKKNSEDQGFVKVVQKKFDDLDILFLRNNYSNEVPQVNLIYDEEITDILHKSIVDKPSIEDIPNNLLNNKYFLNKLTETVNKWGKLTSILVYHSNETIFDSLKNEIEYWTVYYERLKILQKQLKSPEALLTLEIIKKKKKFHKKTDLADELNLSRKIKEVEQIVDILKEINLDNLENSETLIQVSDNMKEIFSHIKKLFSIYSYTADKCMKILENFSAFLTKILIIIFEKEDIMFQNFKDFTELKEMFKKNINHIWNNQISNIKEYFTQTDSLEKAKMSSFVYKMLHSKFLERIKILHEKRKIHENMKKILIKIFDKNDPLHYKTNTEKLMKENDIQELYVSFINSFKIYDISKIGEKNFLIAINEYDNEMELIKKKTTIKIREFLGSTNNYNEKFLVFTKFAKLMKKAKFESTSIKEYENQLMKEVQDNTNLLFTRYKNKYQKSGGIKLAQFYGINDLSGDFIWSHQISSHIQNKMNEIQLIKGENLKNNSVITTFFENFKRLRDKKKNMKKLDKNDIIIYGPLLKLSNIHRNNTLKLIVNFSEDTEKKMMELRSLIQNKEYFQSVLSKKYFFKKEVWPVYINCQRLIETINIWNYLVPKIDEKMTQLLANQLSKVYIKIENGFKYKWNDKGHAYDTYKNYFFEFYEEILDLENATNYLFDKITVIENHIKSLTTCENKFEVIRDILQQIQQILDTLVLKEYTNMEFLVNEINEKIQKIFLKNLTDMITTWKEEFFNYKHKKRIRNKNKLIKSYTLHEIKVKNNSIYIDPPIQHAREQWLNNLHINIDNLICQKKMKVNRYNYDVEKKEDTEDEDFSILLTKAPSNAFLSAYQTVNNIVNDAEKYVKTWLSYQALWDIKIDDFYKRFGDNLKTWQIVLNEIKQGRNTFDTSDFNSNFGPIIVNFKNVQLKINNLYDSLHKDILDEFGIKFTKNSNDIILEVTQQTEKLKNMNFNKADELVENITILNYCKDQVQKWENDVGRCHDNEKLLTNQKYHFDENYKGYDKIENDFKTFKKIYLYKSSMFKNNLDSIKATLKEEEDLLMKNLSNIENVWNNKKPFTSDLSPKEALEVLNDLEKMIFDNKSKLEKLNKAKDLLGMDPIDIELMMNIIKETNNLREIWDNLDKLFIPIEEFMEIPFESMNNTVFTKTLDGILESISMLKPELKDHSIYIGKKKEINKLKKKNKLIRDLKSEAIKKHHLKEILNIIRIQKSPDNLVVGDLFKIDILKNQDKIIEIVSNAQKELVLETMLKKIKDYWINQNFETSLYQKKLTLIKGWDEIMERAGEDLNQLDSMESTKKEIYVLYESEITKWNDKLLTISNVLEVWMDVQRKWVYLEGIFLGSSDIKDQLGNEYDRFMKVDREFKNIMKKIENNSIILDLIFGIPNLLQTLQILMDTLEKIQKSLSDYLETQRQAFSRFYFVGDEDLLEIIGNSKEIKNIQKYFSKMFAGINKVGNREEENQTILTGMASKDNEIVKFKDEIFLNNYKSINLWLLKLEEQMQSSLAKQLEISIEAWKNCETQNMRQVVEKFPTQIGLLGFQTFWTFIMEELIMNGKSTDAIYKKIISFLSFMAEEVLKKLPKITRKRYQQLITEMVHKRDVSKKIAKLEGVKVKDFSWQYYMKYYIKMDEPVNKNRLRVRVGNSEFYYSYEYLGVVEKLVQTPLTDKCYFTLTQALHLRMGGAPFGPAGTGKTESVKMLGSCLGRFVLVFNCDENFNLKAMGRIFIGLCQVGAWGCFDEFNRLEETILSAVSQDILSIQLCLREGNNKLNLMNKQVFLNGNMGIFITMNPGYAGRSNLPENLKQLFRQMAMIKPDSVLIAQVMLFSQGFKSAEELSGKVVAVFELCSDQLSSQPHYDFGLRSLKSVLNSAGNLKRKILLDESVKDPHSLEEEQKIILRSFCDTVVPKLISDDCPLLKSLIQGVFPSSSIPPIEDAQLIKILPGECKRRFLLFKNEKFLEKVLQLSQILKLHHGVMLVGPTGCGKSAAWNTLLSSLTLVDGIKAESYIIDPKAISKDDLYGKLDNTTMEWTDGVFTYILRKICENQRGESSKRHWIIFDGDVDPEWAENLNSVLDDNKLLTLPNGERLSIPSNVKILFEVESLKYATLATVSRCGMVWFSQDILQNKDIYHHYIERLKEEDYDSLVKIKTVEISELTPVREMAVEAIIPIFFENDRDSIANIALKLAEKENHCMIFSRIRVLEALFALIRKGVSKVVEKHESSFGNYTQNNTIVKKFMINWTIFALNWSFAGDLKLSERSEYFLKLQSAIIDKPVWLHWPEINSQTTLIDYQVQLETGDYNLWKNNVPIIDVSPEKVTSSSLIITTVDTLRHQEVLCSWLIEHRPFIICGPPGSGKTMTLMSTLNSLDNFEMIFVNFSSSTSPKLILKQLDQYCEYFKSASKVILRPRQPNKWLVVFCDEINLPDEDKYGTQYVITFLRQLTEQHGFWRCSDKQWVSLERIQFVGACNPPTDAGRHPLAQRFLRHTPLILVDFPGYDSLTQIYGTFNRGMLKRVPSIKTYCDTLTKAMVDYYTDSQKRFTSDQQPHYIYSPRELTRWKYAINQALESVNSLEDLVRLWAHEALRLFEDRLVTAEEKKWCQKKIDEITSELFPGIDSKCLERPIIYSTYLTNSYQSVNLEDLRTFVLKKLKKFSEDVYEVQLVVFDEVLEHIVKIDRVLRQPIGHLLLVGASGVGKTTLSRFVSWINGLEVFQIKAGRKYSLENFEEDLRKVMKKAGCEMKKITFIFDESNVLSVAFLERMNALLASGEIPGLFEGEELASLIHTYKECVSSGGKVVNETDEEIYNIFTKNVQRNLHVVFTMNPANPDFSNRTASSPAIFNRCVIDWFGDWPESALYQVAKELTANFDYKNIDHNVLVELIVRIHKSVCTLNKKLRSSAKKFNYMTPRDYIDFIRQYIALLEEKDNSLKETQKHLHNGLDALKETEESVIKLKKDLIEFDKQLEVKEEEAQQQMEKIVELKKLAKIDIEKSEILKKDIQKSKKESKEEKDYIAKELHDVEPTLKKAETAVGAIKSSQIGEVKNYKTGSELIVLCVAGVISLIKNKKQSLAWDEIKKEMGDKNFLKNILRYKKDLLTKSTIKRIKKDFLEHPKWDSEKIDNSSKAVGPLAIWLESIIKYGEIYSQVEPMRQKIEKLEKKGKKLEEDQKKTEKKIKTCKNNIEQYKADYATLIVEKQKLQNQKIVTSEKTKKAEELLLDLSSEKLRWSDSSKKFKSQFETLTGDVLISAAFLTYCGFFDQFYRELLIENWKNYLNKANLLFDNNLSLIEFLSLSNERINWQSKGLPSDSLCIQNAIILKRFNRYPLIIDPSGQGMDFIKNLYKDGKKDLNCTSFIDIGFMKNLEKCLRFGLPILIKDVEKIDPILNSVLNKEIIKESGRVTIRIGDQVIDFGSDFKLFMITRNSEAQFTPDLCSRVTFVNFTVTKSSLENQFINIYVKNERPDTELKRINLLKIQGEFKVKLRNLENDLLNQISSSRGSNLLENDEMIQKLKTIKKESMFIEEEMNKSDIVLEEILIVTQQYKSLSTISSQLYFLLKKMSSINIMYQYSLKFYMKIISKLLASNEKLKKCDQEDYEERIKVIKNEIFLEVYSKIDNSILERHKLFFAICFSQIKLYSFGDEMVDLFKIIINPCKLIETTLSSSILDGILEKNILIKLEDLSKKKGFTKIIDNLDEKCDYWKDIVNDPERETLENLEFVNFEEIGIDINKDKETEIISKKLVELVIYNILKPEKSIKKFTSLVDLILGKEFLNNNYFNLEISVLEDADFKTPILFASAPGFDPSNKIYELAKKLGKKFLDAAIGSAEGNEEALKKIEKAVEKGNWIILKNVHLAPISWLTSLEQQIYDSKPKASFRIFLLSEFTTKIPITLLRQSIKFIFELPDGVKQSVKRTYNTVFDEQRSNKNPPERCRLHFLLAWIHAVIMERLRYTPTGWSKKYEFSEADQKCALEIIDQYIDLQEARQNLPLENIPFIALRSIITNNIYGGKIDNAFDLKILKSIVDQYLTPDAFDPNKILIQDKNSIVKNPDAVKHKDFKKWIDNLEETETPTWAGLPSSADDFLKIKKLNNLLTVLAKVQDTNKKEIENLEEEKEKNSGLKKIDYMTEVSDRTRIFYNILPNEIDKIERNEELISNPLFRFIEREITVCSLLLENVRKSLKEVIEMADGEKLPLRHTKLLSEKIMKNIVPSNWKKYKTPVALNLSDWIKDLKKRVNQLIPLPRTKNWQKKGINLGEFLFPEAFITASRQLVSQSKKVSMDELELKITFSNNNNTIEEDSFLVKNLWIEGVEWKIDKFILSDEMSCHLKNVVFSWVKADFGDLKDGEIFVPLYLNSDRQNLILKVKVNVSNSGISDKILYQRGIAFIAWKLF